MSKHWKPNKSTVELAPSRIRRAPPARQQTILRRTDQQETWIGAAGVIAIAATLALIILGLGVITIVRATAEPDRSFAQCYNAGASDCVLDGGTLRIGGEQVAIAGLAAPRIQDAACRTERERGIAAAIALSDLLRGGEVTAGAPTANLQGRQARTVKVDGEDVVTTMVEAGHGRRDEGGPQDWCGS